MERKILKASDGMILTNGEIYGSEIYLAEGMDASSFREITTEEYENIMKTEELPMEMRPNPDDATIEDYQEALKKLGVE